MDSFLKELFLIVLLIVANGMFAMSEIAVVSARKVRLMQRANRGDARARAALNLAQEPSRFLSTVQVGITLVGVLTGAYGGATLAEQLGEGLQTVPLFAPYADALALGIVVLAITYFTLIVGELVPKRLGLHNPESVAAAVAGPMRVVSFVAAPLVYVLSKSTDAVMWVLRLPEPEDQTITEDEIKILLRQGTRAGLFEETERVMVESIFRLADLRVGALMTPRTGIEWLDPTDDREELVRAISEAAHSHFPVAKDGLDNVIGVVHAKDLLVRCLTGSNLDLQAATEPLYVPESMRVIKLLELFRLKGTGFALVVDEYGSLEGLITLRDVLSEVVQGIPSPDTEEEPMAFRREDGSWLLDGALPVDRFKDLLDLPELPDEEGGYYQTLGGLVMMQVGHIPTAGEHFEWQGLSIEVMDMDGHRVDKVLAKKLPPPEPQE
ncbi:MAG: hemolysin family protein [FCB group bacterium]|jgi:putative hemolysin|nr:hemolysin family protein [FCB group bacterium]